MNSIRKWIFKPKKTDTALLAKFYFADEELNAVASELDSFDGRKEPDRCTILVNQLRQHQDSVLLIIEQIMKDIIPHSRVRRDYRVKFPDDVLQDSLAGQLWFGAECLAAGSSILNREVESASMRPLARALTQHIDELRSLLRQQCLKNQYSYNDKIIKALIDFDRLFSDFELSYVSAMVPVKTMKEYDLLQDVAVLFCETVTRSMKQGLLNQELFDSYDPMLMFTIPRLAIVCGLLIYPEGPLNPDQDPMHMSDMFRQFQTLLFKIRELLRTLKPEELWTLEQLLCNSGDSPPTLDPNIQLKLTKLGHKYKSRSSTDKTTNDNAKVISAAETNEMKEKDEENVKDEKAGVDADRRLEDGDDEQGDDDIEDGTEDDVEDDVDASKKTRKMRLHHSKTWPAQSPNHANKVKTKPQTKHKISHQPSASSSSSSTTFSSRQRPPANVRSVSWKGSREFNFTLPRNTSIVDTCDENDGDEDDVVAGDGGDGGGGGGSDNREGGSSNNNNGGGGTFASTQVIYLLGSGREGEDNDDDALDCSNDKMNNDNNYNISFITEEFCQLLSNNINNVDNIVETHIDEEDDGNVVSVESLSSLSNQRLKQQQFIHNHYHKQQRQQSDSNDNEECSEKLHGTANISADNAKSTTSTSTPSMTSTTTESHLVETLTNVNVNHGQHSTTTKTTTSKQHGVNFSNSEQIQQPVPPLFTDSMTPSTSMTTINNDNITFAKNIDQLNLNIDQLNLNIDQLNLNDIKSNSLNSSINNNNNNKQKKKTLCLVMDDAEKIFVPPDSWIIKTERPEIPMAINNRDKNNSMEISNNINLVDEIIETSSNSSSLVAKGGYDNEDDDEDEEEMTMVIKIAEAAARQEARSKFKDSSDLVHRLFVCISGVADQLQTNYASDLRHILKVVFECCSTSDNNSTTMITDVAATSAISTTTNHRSISNSNSAGNLRTTSTTMSTNSNIMRTSLSFNSPTLATNPTSSSPLSAAMATATTASIQHLLNIPFSDDHDYEVDRTGLDVYEELSGRAANHSSQTAQDPPIWLPDDSSAQCMSCKAMFTFVRRRHHCRNCGKIFCSHCSSNSVPLPHFGHQKPVRVCNACFLFHVTPFTFVS